MDDFPSVTGRIHPNDRALAVHKYVWGGSLGEIADLFKVSKQAVHQATKKAWWAELEDLELAELRLISDYFPALGHRYQLDPTYEPERHPSWASDPQGIPAPDPDHNAIFKVLQKYNRVSLLVPENAPHMWHAAMESKAVRLTALGEHYRGLAAKGLI